MSQLYKFKIKPYHHQVAALTKLLTTGFGGGLLMEPRTGKTKVCIDYACIQFIKERVSRAVVFCPVGVIEVWKDQIAENCTVPYRILVWDAKARKEYALPSYGKAVLDFVIINYDALSTPGLPVRDRKTGKTKIDQDGAIKRGRRGGRFEVMKKLKLWQPDLMILDESHRIKSPSAKKTHAIHTFDIPYRIIATGTPVTKSKRIFDIYSQWKFLNPHRFVDWKGETLDFGEFKARYGEFTEKGLDGRPYDPRHRGPHYSQWVGNRNEDELHALIHKDSYSVLRSECYDLPPVTEQIIHVELDESSRAYDDMAEDMVARIKTGEITEASIRLVLRVRLSQISGGVAKTMPSSAHPKGRLVVVGSEKIHAITSRLEDLMEANEKVVIGAQFLADITRLEKATKALKVPVFTVRGGMHRDDREWSIQEFRRVSGGAVFIGQPAAASEGIDLSCASILQWYSLTDSWVHYRQFTDRIALSDRPTFVEYFLARGTVDELKYKTLKEDGDIGKLIITRPELLLRRT
jgi:SNF2 family DNA or RNA helicase